MFFFKPTPLVDYKKCVLSEGVDWVIVYYVRDPDTGKLRRMRIKINSIKSIRERRKVAREMMAAIDQKLVLGWNPLTERRAPMAFTTLYEAYDAYLKVKGKEMEESSIRTYSSLLKSFKEWLSDERIDEKSYANSVSRDMATMYMNKVELEKSPKTFNNYLGFFKGMYTWMIDKGYTDVNPFDKIQKKSKKAIGKKNRRMLTDEELAGVIEFLKKENREYLAMCMMCYCCFIRPKEIALLRCRDIDLKKQLIHIDDSIAKNDNESYRTIPNEMIPLLQCLDLTSHPDWYLFGDHPLWDFSPSRKQVCSRKIAKYWEWHVRRACGFGQEIKFYSLKDTGITNMLDKGIPINLVQQQADHSSVAMTAIYVGKRVTANEELRKADILEMEK